MLPEAFCSFKFKVSPTLSSAESILISGFVFLFTVTLQVKDFHAYLTAMVAVPAFFAFTVQEEEFAESEFFVTEATEGFDDR